MFENLYLALRIVISRNKACYLHFRFSHPSPVKLSVQVQLKVLALSMHVPPLWHGLESHGPDVGEICGGARTIGGTVGYKRTK